MRISRRGLLGGAGASAFLGAATSHASAEVYEYDELGRLRKVTYPNNVWVEYRYDAAGNRFQVQGSAAPPAGWFVQTIAVTGAGPINLRTLANSAGYLATQSARITFEVGAGVTITGAAGTSPYPSGAPTGNAGGVAIDTGTWPASPTVIELTLLIKAGGKVFGGGGGGGANTGNGSTGYAGGAGGDALNCQTPISILIENGGELRGGGGGGGSGGSGVNSSGGPPTFGNGGGGGGGFPNGQGGRGANNGGAGSSSAGGAGGLGSISGGAQGGNGGNGGTSSPGGAGANGVGNQGAFAGGAGGAAGNAVRKNGHAVGIAAYGILAGSVVS